MDQAVFLLRKAELQRQIDRCRCEISQAQVTIEGGNKEIATCGNTIRSLESQNAKCRTEIQEHQLYIVQCRQLLGRIDNRNAQLGDAFCHLGTQVSQARSFSNTIKFALKYSEMMTVQAAASKKKVTSQIEQARCGVSRRIEQRIARTNELNNQISCANRRIAENNARVEALKVSIANNKERVQQLNRRVSELQQEINRLRSQVIV